MKVVKEIEDQLEGAPKIAIPNSIFNSFWQMYTRLFCIDLMVKF